MIILFIFVENKKIIITIKKINSNRRMKFVQHLNSLIKEFTLLIQIETIKFKI